MPIKDLKPAASRLLLSAYMRNPEDDFDAVVQKSGISTYATYLKAKEQLQELGFCQEDAGVVVFLRPDVLKSRR